MKERQAHITAARSRSGNNAQSQCIFVAAVRGRFACGYIPVGFVHAAMKLRQTFISEIPRLPCRHVGHSAERIELLLAEKAPLDKRVSASSR